MKKLLNILVCMLLLAAMALTVSAAASAQMTVSANKKAAYRGDVIDFTVKISTVDDCRSAAFMLTYDSNAFEFISGSCTLSGTALANFSAGTGTFAYSSGTTVSGQIFTFKLKVKNDAAFGDHSICANVNTRDSSGAIPTTVNSLSITVACNHSYGAWSKVDDAKHTHSCTICGKEETANHTWDTGSVLKQANCKEGGQVEYTCTACGASKIQDTDKTNEHKYSSWTKVDDSTHTHTCSVCQKVENANHAWDGGKVTKKATCKAEGEALYTCTGCKTTKTEVLAILTTHTYDHGCDTDCNVCGVTRTTTHKYKTSWSKDKSGHWHECSECKDKKDSAAHTPGAEATETTAQTCTVCGYVIKAALGHTHSYAEVWTMDEAGHWYACAGCDEQGSYTDHDFENACDTDCSVCGYIREAAHSYPEEWTSDAANHWHVCNGCGLTADEGAHVPGAEATATVAQTCTVCAYELAPALGGGDTQPTDGTEQTVPDNTDTPVENTFPWWIILVIVVLAAGCAAVVVIVKKKKT